MPNAVNIAANAAATTPHARRESNRDTSSCAPTMKTSHARRLGLRPPGATGTTARHGPSLQGLVRVRALRPAGVVDRPWAGEARRGGALAAAQRDPIALEERRVREDLPR